ncbi:MAG: cytochrome c-type biogenesis protein CcmH [Chromatiales bacterium]|jgi:cytochrome c-type biogenesis protein CcmH
MSVRVIVVLLFFVITAGQLHAATLAEYKFNDPGKEEDFRALIGEMRCLVCQNESLAGSNADLAVDLRNEIYAMMKAGQSKADVIDFMVQRYGDFVLYSPPVKPTTYPIWFGPLLLFLLGAYLLMRALKKKRQSRETTLSEEEQQRLESLLNLSSDTKDSTK